MFLEGKSIFPVRFRKGHPGRRAAKLVRSPIPCAKGRRGEERAEMISVID